jgi:hypothetical protein
LFSKAEPRQSSRGVKSYIHTKTNRVAVVSQVNFEG